MATGTQGLWADAFLIDKYPFGSKFWLAPNHRTPGLDLLESGGGMRDLPDQEGRRVIIVDVTKTNPNAGVGLGESDGMPTGSVSEGRPIVYNVATHYSRCQMSRLLMSVTNGLQRSIMNLKSELKLQRTAFRNKMGWLIHADGSGEIAQVSSGTNAGVITTQAYASIGIVKKDAEVILRHRTTGALFGGLTAGRAYRVTATANNKSSAGSTITIVDATTGVAPDLSATGAGGAIDSNYGIYFYDSQGKSIVGLGMSCSASNPGNWGSVAAFYGGIDRSDPDNADWQAFEVDAGSKNIDIAQHVQYALDNIDELGGDDVDSEDDDMLYGFTGYDVWRSLGNQMSQDQRTVYKPEDVKGKSTLSGGYKAIVYERLKVVSDRYAPFRELRIQNPKTLYRRIMEELAPIDLGGSFWKMVSGLAGDGRDNDVWVMTMASRQYVASVLCNGNARIKAINASR